MLSIMNKVNHDIFTIKDLIFLIRDYCRCSVYSKSLFPQNSIDIISFTNMGLNGLPVPEILNGNYIGCMGSYYNSDVRQSFVIVDVHISGQMFGVIFFNNFRIGLSRSQLKLHIFNYQHEYVIKEDVHVGTGSNNDNMTGSNEKQIECKIVNKNKNDLFNICWLSTKDTSITISGNSRIMSDCIKFNLTNPWVKRIKKSTVCFSTNKSSIPCTNTCPQLLSQKEFDKIEKEWIGKNRIELSKIKFIAYL